MVKLMEGESVLMKGAKKKKKKRSEYLLNLEKNGIGWSWEQKDVNWYEPRKHSAFSPLNIQPFSAMVKLMEGESALMKGAKKKKKIEYLLN